MLLEFNFSNFKSFKDNTVFSSVADTNAVRTLKENIVNIGTESILRTSVLYGPNAGGKSNFASAYYSMLSIIKKSFSNNDVIKNLVTPYMLDETTKKIPSTFEVKFIIESKDNIMCRFGFSILDNRIISEWLYKKSLVPRSRELLVYERNGDKLNHGLSLPNGGVIGTIEKQDLLKDSTLLFSLLYSLNNPLIMEINDLFFKKNISASALFLSSNDLIPETIIDNESMKKAYLYLLKKADTGIEDFKIEKDDDKYEVLTGHSVLQEDGTQDTAFFEMTTMESRGTQKLFNMLGIILTTLKNGGVLIIDEIDTQLHPHLTNLIFNLFNDPAINIMNSQLLAITHEHSLLNISNIRKDQVWFIQKNRENSSELYSLLDFENERSVHSFGKRYLEGQYGAIPNIGDINFLTEFFTEEWK